MSENGWGLACFLFACGIGAMAVYGWALAFQEMDRERAELEARMQRLEKKT